MTRTTDTTLGRVLDSRGNTTGETDVSTTSSSTGHTAASSEASAREAGGVGPGVDHGIESVGSHRSGGRTAKLNERLRIGGRT
ncbi:hypothetical protein [Haloarcula sediminis]|uniref:hypothetical protein n=1 Tax=Haloarcula sediminis TaxID=3111777 RepID=UPI002D782B49|nr:hypothetical protein [Haloarcula sp. CK38]